MGIKEFIASIEAEGTARLCAIWSQAETEAASAFAEYARAMAEADRTMGASASVGASAPVGTSAPIGVGRKAGTMRARIGLEARRIALEAEAALSGRMLDLATSRVASRLRCDGYALAPYAAELPHGVRWNLVRVHPDDAAAASSLFDGARIEPDDGISGGLVAECAEIGLVVDNTIAARLRRAWPQMAGGLILRAREMAGA